MDSGEFDPRFDPAFQPGFVPDKHRPGPRRLFGHGTSAASGSSRLSAAGDEVRGASDEVSARSRQTRLGEGIVEQERPGFAVAVDRQPVPLGRNPYVWALWVVSPSMVFGGYLLYWWANNDSGGFSGEGSRSPFLFLLQQSAWVMSPALVMVGLAGLVGLLFLHATRWRPGGRVEDTHADDATAATPASSR